MVFQSAWHIAAQHDMEKPMAKPEAVGLVDFTAKRGAKERAAVFQGALLPDPATLNEKVREALSKYLPPDDLEGVLTMLSERGWEATEAVFAERARDAKRQWREITGKTYGVRVAGGLATRWMVGRLRFHDGATGGRTGDSLP